jgi:LysR family transcriptional regulator for metE and metH
VEHYLARGYVAQQRIGEAGLTGRLYAVSSQRLAGKPFLADFVRLMRETSLINLPGVSLL